MKVVELIKKPIYEEMELFEKKFKKLDKDPKYVLTCPCGKTKQRIFNAARFDASQFFKEASLPRGLS